MSYTWITPEKLTEQLNTIRQVVAMVLTGTMVRVARRLNGKKTSGNG